MAEAPLRSPPGGGALTLLGREPRRHARWTVFGLALATAMVSLPDTAHAELMLRWEAPAECPQHADVVQRLRSLAGSALDRTEDLSVDGRIDRAGGRYSLTLLVREGTEPRRRVISSDSCANLAGAAAVTLALLLGVDVSAVDPSASSTSQNGTSTNDGATNDNPTGTQPSQPKPAEPQKPAPLTPPPDELDESPDSPNAERSSRWALLFRAPIGSADFGPLPRPALGLGVGVGARYASWRFLASGRISAEQTVNAPAPNNAAGAELDRWTAELSVCHGWRIGAFELAPCVGGALEHVTARGFGEGVIPQAARRSWPALGAGAVMHWYPSESFAFFLGVTGYVELSRPELVIEGLGSVGDLEPAAIGAAIGAEWIF